MKAKRERGKEEWTQCIATPRIVEGYFAFKNMRF